MNLDFIQKLKVLIDANLENEKFGVSELANEIGLSRSQLHRRLQDIYGKSSSQFIREYRLEKAMEMLKKNQGTASEIAYRVGFSSPTYFNTSFKNFYGYPPGEVKYQRAIAPPKKAYSKKLAGFIPVVIIVGLIVFYQAFNKGNVDSPEVEKSIAVLPFVNDSNNEDNLYFCNGIMAGIRDHLAKIPEFYVASRLSVEPYKNTSIPLKAIATELNVNYIIEGRVQRIGDRTIISAELIQVNNNKVIWSERYDENVSEIFEVQKKVIESITNNLETIISPNLNNELIKKPAQNELAYEYYLKGEEYRFRANQELQKTDNWLDLLNKSKLSYELAIEQDTLFAEAYLGLAFSIYKKEQPYVLYGNKIDHILPLISKTLQLKPNLELAYLLRGDYYKLFKRNNKARDDFNKVLELNPNNVYVLSTLIELYKNDNNFNELGITLNKLKKIARSKDDFFILYINYAELYHLIEEYNMADYYFAKLSELRPEDYFSRSQLWSYISSLRIDEAIDYLKKKTHKDNQDRNAHLGILYQRKGDYKQALSYSKKAIIQVNEKGINSRASLHIYVIYGTTLIYSDQNDEGIEMIKKQISVYNKILNDRQVKDTFLILINMIAAYGILGEYEKAYEYMQKFEDANGWNMSGLLYLANHAKEYDYLKDDKQFQQFLGRGKNHIDSVKMQLKPYLPSTQANIKD